LVLALINQDGFPFSYEVFDGNRADVTTVEAILRTVERKHGKARRVWIFDRGVVSEENLVAIRKRGGEYLVGTMRSKLKQFEAEVEGGFREDSAGCGSQADRDSGRGGDLHPSELRRLGR
jgi:transposase